MATIVFMPFHRASDLNPTFAGRIPRDSRGVRWNELTENV